MATGEVNYRLKSDSGDFVAGVEKAERSVKGLDKEQKKAGKSADALGKQSASINKLKGAFVGLGSVVAGLGITAAFRKMVENTSRQDAALTQLNTTLNSTQFAAGRTADELTRTAAELQKVTKFGDEAIIEMQSLLLTFKDIKGDNFDRTSVAILDMATAMNVDLKSATIQLGKALNDPTRNLSALTRSGIQFNEAQTEMIKQMQASGDMAGAQAIILKELESQFGNSATAARDTLGGAIAGLSNAFNDLFEAEKKTSSSLVRGINAVEKAISSKGFKDGLNLVIESLKTLFGWIGKVYEGWYQLGGLLSSGIAKLREWGLFKDDLDALGESLVEPVEFTEQLVVATTDATDAMEDLVEVVVEAERKNLDLGASASRAAASIKAQAGSVMELEEVTVTAKRRNTEFAESAVDAAEQTSAGWSSTGSVMSDFFSNLVTDGENAFGSLLKSFGSMLLEMAAQAAANRILVSVGAGAAGSLAAGSASAAGGGLEALLGGGGAALAANPWVAAGVIAGGFVLNSVFGEDNNGNNSGIANFDLGTGLIDGQGVGKSFDQKNVDSATQIAGLFQTFATAIGGSEFSGKVKVGNDGVKLNGELFGSEEELIDFAFQSIIEQSSDLTDELKTLLLAFEGTTDETIQFAGAIKALSDNAGINTVTQAIEDFANNPSVGESFVRSLNDVNQLIAAYDGTAESASALSQAFASNKALAYDFAVAIQTVGKELSVVAEEQAEYIRESVLSADVLQAKRIEERDALLELLDSITDPEELAAATNRILELNRQVFDSLSEEERLEQAESFAQIAENANAVAQEGLERSLDALQESQEDMNERVSQMLDAAAQSQQEAANTQMDAAKRQDDASKRLERAARELSSTIFSVRDGELI